MFSESPSAAEEKKSCTAGRLALEVRRGEDREQNRQLIGLLMDSLTSRIRRFTVFGPGGQFRFLEQVRDSLIRRHLQVERDPRRRELSWLYQYRPEEDGDFISYICGKLKKPGDAFEPHATCLVRQILAGQDEEKNKRVLAGLLYPFISWTAYQSMHGSHYRICDIEEAAAFQVERLISLGREGRTGKNGRHYGSWLYEFDPDRGYDFCTYLSARLHAQFLTWCRKMDGVQAFREEIREEDGTAGTRTYYASAETSMDAGDTGSEGKEFESSRSALAAARAAEENLRLREERQRELQLREKEADAVARLFLDFFDYVDGLDEDRPGARSVTERGILSYHLKFACGIWNRLGKDGCSDDREDLRRYAEKRPRSFRKMAAALWNRPLLQAVSFQSGDYRLLFRREYPYLDHLVRRVRRRGLEEVPYLETEKDIGNRAAGWAATVERRTEKEYETMITQRFRKIRRELCDEIQ